MPPHPEAITEATTEATKGELERLRARTLAELQHQLESRRLDAAEFERRTELAVLAESALELRPLVADLLANTGSHAHTPAVAPPDAAPHVSDTQHAVQRGGRSPADDHDWSVAFMSGSRRSGHWDPAENVTALCLMGGVRLDFREAAFLEGVVTKVSVFCLMGGCLIIVPPDIHVSVSGLGLLGGFGHVAQTAPDPDAPRLHISGLAIMGGVEIKVRDIGESGDEEDDD